MPTLYLPPERREFFADHETGQWTIYKDEDSILSYTVDWSRVLGTDTISSVTWTVSGVTSVSQSNTTTTTTIKLSGSGGSAKATVVTAGGSTHVQTLNFIEAGQSVSAW